MVESEEIKKMNNKKIENKKNEKEKSKSLSNLNASTISTTQLNQSKSKISINNKKQDEIPKNKIRCQVTYLDGAKKIFDIDKASNGQQLFDLVCNDLDLKEKEYFSLTYRDSNNMEFWIDHDKKIKSQLKGVISDLEPHFNFGVKFYPPEPQLLQEEITRYLLTLQLRRDIMDGKLPCSFVTHALLGSYTVQAELGDYDPEQHGLNSDYLRNFYFAPVQTPQLFEAVANYHKDHKGQSPAEAEMHFLENAVKLAMYGVDLHNARDSDSVDILIGVSASGIMVYRDHLRINRFSWPKIIKISYKRNYFYLKLRAAEYELYQNTIGFRCPNHKAAKRLWKIAVEHHAFFRLREPEKPKKTLLPTFNQRYRYTGSSTYLQTRQRSIDRQSQSEISRSKHLAKSMDRGLAVLNTSTSSSSYQQNNNNRQPNNMSTLSIPDNINRRDSEEDEEGEYVINNDNDKNNNKNKNISNNANNSNKVLNTIINNQDASIGAFDSSVKHNLSKKFTYNNDDVTDNSQNTANLTNRTDNKINNNFNNKNQTFSGGVAASSTPILNKKFDDPQQYKTNEPITQNDNQRYNQLSSIHSSQINSNDNNEITNLKARILRNKEKVNSSVSDNDNSIRQHADPRSLYGQLTTEQNLNTYNQNLDNRNNLSKQRYDDYEKYGFQQPNLDLKRQNYYEIQQYELQKQRENEEMELRRLEQQRIQELEKERKEMEIRRLEQQRMQELEKERKEMEIRRLEQQRIQELEKERKEMELMRLEQLRIQELEKQREEMEIKRQRELQQLEQIKKKEREEAEYKKKLELQRIEQLRIQQEQERDRIESENRRKLELQALEQQRIQQQKEKEKYEIELKKQELEQIRIQQQKQIKLDREREQNILKQQQQELQKRLEQMKMQQINKNQHQQLEDSFTSSRKLSTNNTNNTQNSKKYIEKTLIIGSEETHQDIILKAIRLATELDPNLEVEKVEITSEE